MKLSDILVDNFIVSSTLLKMTPLIKPFSKSNLGLLKGVEITNYDYTFYVIENEEVNAFATLGGNIFIFSGLLNFADSPKKFQLY